MLQGVVCNPSMDPHVCAVGRKSDPQSSLWKEYMYKSIAKVTTFFMV